MFTRQVINQQADSPGDQKQACKAEYLHFICLIISVAKKEACEFEKSYVNISCSDGQLINVVEAIYGRLQTDICSSQDFDKACSASGLSVVSDRLLNEKEGLNKKSALRCNSQQSCSIQASNGNFGDPCGGTVKQLFVRYTCSGIV